MTPTPAKLSACVITYNEADRIEACLASVSFCDELVVVDAHSTDATRDLAHSLGARVIERDWAGFRSQKEYAVSIASNNWVLCIDADERVSDELRAEIEVARMQRFIGYSGWSTPRITDYFGRFRGHLEHYSYRSMSDHEKRMQKYAELMADAMYRRGKRTHLLNVWINPAWRFVRGYFLRLGFLDGWRGLMFAIIETHYVHQKYLKLFLKQKGLPS